MFHKVKYFFNLESHGVLGINRRNLQFVYPGKAKYNFRVLDNKIYTKQLLTSHNIKMAKTVAVIENFLELKAFIKVGITTKHFVIKPARGSQGSGIKILSSSDSPESIQAHCAEILMGQFTNGKPSEVLIEEFVESCTTFKEIYAKGLSDVRLITHNAKFIMAMVRFPSNRSSGKSNLHQGGVGVALDIKSGRLGKGWYMKSRIDRHPDSKVLFSNIIVPNFNKIKELVLQVCELIPIPYMGFDFVLDENDTPLIMELNGRPGLEIQNVNDAPLLKILSEVDNAK